MMNDPIAYFVTISTFGTWLPGDERGWIEYHRGWKMPDPLLELESLARMDESACILERRQRVCVEKQLVETCLHRGWVLHAKNCRTNHLHVVVSARNTKPTKIRRDLKSWCTRRLKAEFDPSRESWWAERGSIRYVFDEDGLEAVVRYVNEAQDVRKS